MMKIHVSPVDSIQALESLTSQLNGDLLEQWGEYVLTFDNEIGKGSIRLVNFDRGISLLDYNVCFNQEVEMEFETAQQGPIEFIFISEGTIHYQSDQEAPQKLEQYQNVIISHKSSKPKTYFFSAKTPTKINFIRVATQQYAKKKNNNLSYLSKELLDIFEDKSTVEVYKHFGNFNLKIADRIRDLNRNTESGIIRTLSIEGQLNLILAMQILEHHNFSIGKAVSESISKKDIKKIHELVVYIIDNISEAMTVTSLANHIGFSPKKLQLGFRMLYDKSVNEYLQQLKLEIARDSIRTTNATISEIVYQVGFKNRSYFSKLFFERYGVLPTAYRKMLHRE